MAQDFKTFLAATILTEGNIVSYRSLSRELKIHGNAAKKALYDFHRSQNSKKPGSVQATYILEGVPSIVKESGGVQGAQDGEDVQMQSSPYMSSSMPQAAEDEFAIPSTKVTLVREADLEGAKSTFESIRSIHVYSLSPAPLQNLQALSECNRAISAKFQTEDPLVVGSQYGVIHNGQTRRRTGKRPFIAAPAAPVKKSVGKTTNSAPDTKPAAQNTDPVPRPSSSGKPTKTSTQDATKEPIEKKDANKPRTLKREQSDIFKSFSKPKSKLSREDTGSSTGTSPAPTQVPKDANAAKPNEPMRDASEDENEEDFVVTKEAKPETGVSRSEREEKLRKMMDDEDEVMAEDKEEPTSQASQDSEPVDVPSKQSDASPEPPVTVTGGRRRGRRKVMKKKTVKDEEGYLVTKEEPAWESFSEDEPKPVKERAPVSSNASSSAKSKKASSSGKAGQGNIMSFFGKK